MSELLPGGTALAAFLAATLVLAVTPGPGVLYVAARTLSQGRAAGLASVAGVAAGNFGNAVAASIGLAAVFAASAAAYTVVKYAGAAYLVVLGLQALRRPATQGMPPRLGAVERWRIFRDGAFVALLNPKTAIFFAAFLPQFIDSSASPVAQSLALSAVFVVVAACTDSAYVLLSAVLAPLLRNRRRLAATGHYGSALVYFGLGAYTLLAGARGAGPAPR